MSAKQFIQSREEMESILREENLGYLGLSTDGMPYVVPLNYAYAEGKIVFHCALVGKKLDYLRANPQVCFTVGRQAGKIVRHPQGAVCHVENDSVICYGHARIVEAVEERQDLLNISCYAVQLTPTPLFNEERGTIELIIPPSFLQERGGRG